VAISDQNHISSVSSLFDLAARLTIHGVPEPVNVFINRNGTGIFDVMPPTDTNFNPLIETATSFSHMIEAVPQEKKATLAEPMLRLMLEDASRLDPETRAHYISDVYSSFRWTDELGTGISELDGKGRTKEGQIEETGGSRLPGPRLRRMPMLGLLMAQDENQGSQFVSGKVLEALDNKDIRSRLSTDTVFREFVRFLGTVRIAETTVRNVAADIFIGVPTDRPVVKLSGAKALAPDLLRIGAPMVRLPEGYRLDGGYLINGETFVAFKRTVSGHDETILVRQQPKPEEGMSPYEAKEITRYYHARLEATAAAEWLGVARENIEYTNLSQKQRSERGMSEGQVDSRTTFVSSRTRHLNSMWSMYGEGRISGTELIGFSRTLAGKVESAEFTSAIAENYSHLVSELKIPQTWIVQNIELFVEFVSYRRTLDALAAGGINVFKEVTARPEQFAQARQLLDQAIIAHVQGRFSEFKFPKEFAQELLATAGTNGPELLKRWTEESTFTVRDPAGTEYKVEETGGFERAFLVGLVRGETACQHPRNGHPVVAGVAGSVVQPWVRQIVIKIPGSPEALYRRSMTLMVDADGKPVILLQPAYGMNDTPEAQTHVDQMIIEAIRARYEPLDIEVRPVRGGVKPVTAEEERTMPSGRVLPAGRELNRGYHTFKFRAPFAYFDSNMTRTIVRYGQSKREGQNGLHVADTNQTITYDKTLTLDVDLSGTR
jgi:hypothetical protein